MKIAVYGIALNEAKFAARYAACAAEADLIMVADTGSTDETVAILEAAGVDVRHIRIRPWRFDDARNAALALLPDDVDVCVSLDLDTVLNPGWRKALEAAWVPGANRGFYTEIWGRHADGQPRKFLNNRIHARHGFRWRAPCHEYVAHDRTEVKTVVIKGLVIEQFADPDKSRGQYLPLLELACKEEPNSPRAAHYLGRELYFHGRYADAIVEFKRYLTLPDQSFVSERSGTIRLMAQCYDFLGQSDEGLRWFKLSTEETPRLRGPWIDLAYSHYKREEWAECYAAAVRSITTAIGTAEYGEESVFGVLPEDLACVTGWRLGHHRQALEYGRRALALTPGVERIRANVEKMEKALAHTAPRAGQDFGQTIEGVVER